MGERLTPEEYDAALEDYYAKGGKPIELSSVFATVIDPATGEQKAGTGVSAVINIGKWNEEVFYVDPEGKKTVDWGETVARRWKNAPLLWGGGAAAGGFLLWRLFR